MELRLKVGEMVVGFWHNRSKIGVILAPGLPEYITKNHPFVKKINEREFDLFVLRYPGTWESGGNFDLKSAVRGIEDVVLLAKSGEARELYGGKILKWNYSTIFLIGFSFGSLPVLLSQVKDVEKVLLFPFVNSFIHSKNGGEDIPKLFQFIQEAYPNVYRFNPKSLLTEIDNIDYPKSKKQLLVFSGINDSLIPKQEIEWLLKNYSCRHIELNTGHSLSLPDGVYDLLFGGAHETN